MSFSSPSNSTFCEDLPAEDPIHADETVSRRRKMRPEQDENSCVSQLRRRRIERTTAASSPGSSLPSAKIERPSMWPRDQKVYCRMRRLGKGGCSSVTKVQHPDPATGEIRELALKITNMNKARVRSFESNVFRECQILNRIQHPNIVTCHSWWNQGKRVYALLDLCETDLLHLLINLEENGLRMPMHMVAFIARSCARGLEYCHAQEQMVHCDIKVDNLLVRSNGQIVIADFALCRPPGESGVYGTSSMEAPECRRRKKQKDSAAESATTPKLYYAADTWALGCVVVETIALQTLDDCLSGPEEAIQMIDEASEGQSEPFTTDDDLVDFCNYTLDPDHSKRWLPKDILKCRWIQKHTDHIGDFLPELLSIRVKSKTPVHIQKYMVVRTT